MGHWRSTSAPHLMNSHSGTETGQLGGCMASTNSISFTDQASRGKKDGRGEGATGATGWFFTGPLSIWPSAVQRDVRVENDILAEWSMIQGTAGIWLFDIHHRGEVRGELIVNYPVSGKHWEGQCRGWIQEGGAQDKICTFVMPLVRANCVSMTQV